ncbi:MAG: glycine/sarcosine/betaine reductase selenoprotein B family protein [Thermoanaerobaculia bacterium]|nr:glycine/sarcosine/betaine reductase selenoprotein B family protein [Thermoanaerobaculia bacterium]
MPYTPYDRDLSDATVTIASAAGVHLSSQEAFPSEDPGDISYREIPHDASTDEMRITHHHYDHQDADRDPNIMFPLESLRNLASEGFIKAVNDVHYSLGFTTRLRDLYEVTYPEIANKIDRSKTKLVILTAGCPSTCHRSVVNLAREIEAIGIPTLTITASPAATEAVRPPRAMTFEGCEIGKVIGPPGDRKFQEKVLRAALATFTEDTPPGKVVTKSIT